MKILVIPAWFNHQNKIEGIFIHQFCEAMQKSGQEVTLLYVKMFSFSNIFTYFKKIEIEYECNFDVLIIKKLNVYPSVFFKNAVYKFRESVLKKVLSLVNKKSFDIIHIQSVCNNITPFFAVEISREKKIPYVITEHYTSFEEAGDKIFTPYLNSIEVHKIVSKANYRVAVSKFAAEKFDKIFLSRFITIPNIIGNTYFEKPFKEINFESSNTFRFIFIGGLSQRKGVLELINAFFLLTKEFSNVLLTMVGDGDLSNEIKSFITNHKLQAQIDLVGQKTENEIIKLLDEHHCLVSASEVETFGLVIVESFLRGRPVVCVNSGAVDELINSKNGILSSSEDKVTNLLNSMKQVIISYASFNQLEIRNTAVSKFNELTIINQYLTIYKKAIQ